MPSTITAYGVLIAASESDRYHHELGAARAAVAERVGEPGTVNVHGLYAVAPVGECEWESAHAPATDELVWLTRSHELLGGHDDHRMTVCRGCLPDAVADMLRDPELRSTPHVHVGVLQQLVVLRVPDWSERRGYRQLVVSVRCPSCGQLRGRPGFVRRWDETHGVHDVHEWTNPCGHTDELAALVAEDAAITAEQHRTGVAA